MKPFEKYYNLKKRTSSGGGGRNIRSGAGVACMKAPNCMLSWRVMALKMMELDRDMVHSTQGIQLGVPKEKRKYVISSQKTDGISVHILTVSLSLSHCLM